ncbi:hypothetical protein ABZ499_27450 [Streptomyces sp. NPDC019990]|uniref:hypothetical protein n=1 Tax=Streptomyces sp. NPDC019990 TaxID=3154693 RepID=UPI0033F9C72C
MAIYFLNTTTGPVDLTTLPTPTQTPVSGCLHCGGELSPLIGDNGEIRTVFCEHCD